MPTFRAKSRLEAKGDARTRSTLSQVAIVAVILISVLAVSKSFRPQATTIAPPAKKGGKHSNDGLLGSMLEKNKAGSDMKNLGVAEDEKGNGDYEDGSSTSPSSTPPSPPESTTPPADGGASAASKSASKADADYAEDDYDDFEKGTVAKAGSKKGSSSSSKASVRDYDYVDYKPVAKEDGDYVGEEEEEEEDEYDDGKVSKKGRKKAVPVKGKKNSGDYDAEDEEEDYAGGKVDLRPKAVEKKGGKGDDDDYAGGNDDYDYDYDTKGSSKPSSKVVKKSASKDLDYDDDYADVAPRTATKEADDYDDDAGVDADEDEEEGDKAYGADEDAVGGARSGGKFERAVSIGETAGEDEGEDDYNDVAASDGRGRPVPVQRRPPAAKQQASPFFKCSDGRTGLHVVHVPLLLGQTMEAGAAGLFISTRLLLFRDFFLPSITHQTAPSFVLYVSHDPDQDTGFLKATRDALKLQIGGQGKFSLLVPDSAGFYAKKADKLLAFPRVANLLVDHHVAGRKAVKDVSVYLTTAVHPDDALHSDALKLVQEQACAAVGTGAADRAMAVQLTPQLAWFPHGNATYGVLAKPNSPQQQPTPPHLASLAVDAALLDCDQPVNVYTLANVMEKLGTAEDCGFKWNASHNYKAASPEGALAAALFAQPPKVGADGVGAAGSTVFEGFTPLPDFDVGVIEACGIAPGELSATNLLVGSLYVEAPRVASTSATDAEGWGKPGGLDGAKAGAYRAAAGEESIVKIAAVSVKNPAAVATTTPAAVKLAVAAAGEKKAAVV